MIFNLSILTGIVERGLIFGLVICAVYLSTRLIAFDDLSVEGSFGLGGAVTALWLVHSWCPFTALVIASCAGALAGAITGILHTKLKLNNLISGVVTTTALFSINLKLAGANAALNTHRTIFDFVPNTLATIKCVIILLPLCVGILYGVQWLLTTQVGLLLKAVGSNPRVLTALGKSSHRFIVFTLALANGLTALAGALFVQYVGYFSIWAGLGIFITSLIGLIIAQMVSSSCGPLLIVGSIAYQTIVAITFEFDVDQDWNKLITALLIIVLFTLRRHTMPQENERA